MNNPVATLAMIHTPPNNSLYNVSIVKDYAEHYKDKISTSHIFKNQLCFPKNVF